MAAADVETVRICVAMASIHMIVVDSASNENRPPGPTNPSTQMIVAASKVRLGEMI